MPTSGWPRSCLPKYVRHRSTIFVIRHNQLSSYSAAMEENVALPLAVYPVFVFSFDYVGVSPELLAIVKLHLLIVRNSELSERTWMPSSSCFAVMIP